MTNPLPAAGTFKKLDGRREILYPHVLFDSNVIRANDQVAEDRLLSLTELLLGDEDRGNAWFSMPSLLELLAPGSAVARIEVLRRFQNLYSRFGKRVAFIGGRGPYPTVKAEWGEDRRFMQTPAEVIDEAVRKSVAAGDLVGVLKVMREKWATDRARLKSEAQERSKKLQARYAADASTRDSFAMCIARLGTLDALEQCDDLAVQLIVGVAGRPFEDLERAKANPENYPCTWTHSLLRRLADYAATLSRAEWREKYSQYGGLLEARENDYVDAYIAGDGGGCGMMITNDEGLIDRINFLHDAKPSLIRLQAFTVHDALIAYNPPNGTVRDRSK